VTRIFDGPSGYSILVDNNGRHAEIRRKADLPKLLGHPGRKK
jgi:hypothetical protein